VPGDLDPTGADGALTPARTVRQDRLADPECWRTTAATVKLP
jgi:hypothetical protein